MYDTQEILEGDSGLNITRHDNKPSDDISKAHNYSMTCVKPFPGCATEQTLSDTLNTWRNLQGAGYRSDGSAGAAEGNHCLQGSPEVDTLPEPDVVLFKDFQTLGNSNYENQSFIGMRSECSEVNKWEINQRPTSLPLKPHDVRPCSEESSSGLSSPEEFFDARAELLLPGESALFNMKPHGNEDDFDDFKDAFDTHPTECDIFSRKIHRDSVAQSTFSETDSSPNKVLIYEKNKRDEEKSRCENNVLTDSTPISVQGVGHNHLSTLESNVNLKPSHSEVIQEFSKLTETPDKKVTDLNASGTRQALPNTCGNTFNNGIQKVVNHEPVISEPPDVPQCISTKCKAITEFSDRSLDNSSKMNRQNTFSRNQQKDPIDKHREEKGEHFFNSLKPSGFRFREKFVPVQDRCESSLNEETRKIVKMLENDKVCKVPRLNVGLQDRLQSLMQCSGGKKATYNKGPRFCSSLVKTIVKRTTERMESHADSFNDFTRSRKEDMFSPTFAEKKVKYPTEKIKENINPILHTKIQHCQKASNTIQQGNSDVHPRLPQDQLYQENKMNDNVIKFESHKNDKDKSQLLYHSTTSEKISLKGTRESDIYFEMTESNIPVNSHTRHEGVVKECDRNLEDKQINKELRCYEELFIESKETEQKTQSVCEYYSSNLDQTNESDTTIDKSINVISSPGLPILDKSRVESKVTDDKRMPGISFEKENNNIVHCVLSDSQYITFLSESADLKRSDNSHSNFMIDTVSHTPPTSGRENSTANTINIYHNESKPNKLTSLRVTQNATSNFTTNVSPTDVRAKNASDISTSIVTDSWTFDPIFERKPNIGHPMENVNKDMKTDSRKCQKFNNDEQINLKQHIASLNKVSSKLMGKVKDRCPEQTNYRGSLSSSLKSALTQSASAPVKAKRPRRKKVIRTIKQEDSPFPSETRESRSPSESSPTETSDSEMAGEINGEIKSPLDRGDDDSDCPEPACAMEKTILHKNPNDLGHRFSDVTQLPAHTSKTTENTLPLEVALACNATENAPHLEGVHCPELREHSMPFEVTNVCKTSDHEVPSEVVHDSKLLEHGFLSEVTNVCKTSEHAVPPEVLPDSKQLEHELLSEVSPAYELPEHTLPLEDVSSDSSEYTLSPRVSPVIVDDTSTVPIKQPDVIQSLPVRKTAATHISITGFPETFKLTEPSSFKSENLIPTVSEMKKPTPKSATLSESTSTGVPVVPINTGTIQMASSDNYSPPKRNNLDSEDSLNLHARRRFNYASEDDVSTKKDPLKRWNETGIMQLKAKNMVLRHCSNSTFPAIKPRGDSSRKLWVQNTKSVTVKERTSNIASGQYTSEEPTQGKRRSSFSEKRNSIHKVRRVHNAEQENMVKENHMQNERDKLLPVSPCNQLNIEVIKQNSFEEQFPMQKSTLPIEQNTPEETPVMVPCNRQSSFEDFEPTTADCQMTKSCRKESDCEEMSFVSTNSRSQSRRGSSERIRRGTKTSFSESLLRKCLEVAIDKCEESEMLNDDVPIAESSPMHQETLNKSLARAVARNNANKVRDLLLQGANPNVSSGQLPALLRASKEGALYVVQALVSAGADVDARSDQGNSALHEAARAGHNEIVVHLIYSNAYIDAINRNGVTPLQTALSYGQVEVIQTLIRYNADVYLQNKVGESAIAIAEHLGYVGLTGTSLEVRRDSGPGTRATTAKMKVPVAVQLILGLEEGCPIAIEECLYRGANCNTVVPLALHWPAYATVLHRAAHHGHDLIARQLLQAGANVNARDVVGNTPLHAAAQAGHNKVVKVLLANGALMEATSRSGITPLHRAASKGKELTCNLLMRRGANTRAEDNEGRTPADWATKRRFVSVARKLGYRRKSSTELLAEEGSKAYIKHLHELYRASQSESSHKQEDEEL